MKPKISVIIPVYNTENYLRECLDSVCNQTLRELEIICIDDGSTDSSGMILDEYACNDTRLRVVHQDNGGQSVARNCGIAMATGEYVQFVDSDDWLDLSACEKMYARAKKTGADMTVTQYQRVLEEGTIIEIHSFLTLPPYEVTEDKQKVQFIWELGNGTWQTLYALPLLQSSGHEFPEKINYNEDFVFAFQAAICANKIVFLFERLYYYRDRENSTVHVSENLLHVFSAFQYLFAHLPDELKNNSKLMELLELHKIRTVLNTYALTYPNYSVNREFVKRLKSNLSDREWDLIRSSALDLNFRQRTFLLSLKGPFLSRWVNFLKYRKHVFCDWLALKLFPHSCYMQELIARRIRLQTQGEMNVLRWKELLDKASGREA